MKVIGITGGVGAGKSTVLDYISSKYKSRVIFSDDVANDIKKKGMPCYDKIVELLGDGILAEDKEIDKKKMADVIFSDKELLDKVNEILHVEVNSYIRSEIDRERKDDKFDYLFVEAALLIENGYKENVDEMWYVFAREEIRRKRLKESRNYTDEKIDKILKSQLSEEEFRKNCDFVIDNSTTIEDVQKQIDAKLGDDAAMTKQSEKNVVFGLDIGTRSVVGTVGYMEDEIFNVIAQTVRKHETRAMLDGQIHDIGKVGATIKKVKEELERQTQIELTDVCIAAAGRVLRTVKTNYEEEFTDNRELTQEEIYNLESKAVEKAYQEFLEQNQSEMKFYLVGYSVMHYYLDDYQIANLEGHNAGRVALDLIATFLPDDCVDGLYKACERADLKVANMTLEPIAAMMVAIPPQYRMLNLALVDVGAGTSDICITDDGTITSYGMLPIAGDSITEIIAQHCLVDFNTADQIKIDASHMDQVKYVDIMGLEKTISSKDISKMIRPLVEKMSKMVTQQIKQLNGNKPVSAVFVVGGGGCVPGYTKLLAKEMKIPEERVALRGEEVMKSIKFLNEDSDIARDSLMVTPLGICISFYEQSNNFVFVSFNGQQTKIYDNGKLAIVDAAMQANFPNEDLFPKRGEELRFQVNGQERMVRGEPGEPAVITLNGVNADIHTKIHANDIIEVTSSTVGKAGSSEISDIPEFKGTFNITVDGKSIDVPRMAEVNGEKQTGLYDIKSGDDIKILDYETAEQIAQLLDIELTEDTVITVNNEVAGKDTPVYENFKVEFKSGADAVMEYYANFPDADEIAIEQENEESSYEADGDLDVEENEDGSYSISGNEEKERQAAPPMRVVTKDLHVVVNNEPVTLHGKSDYIFVDIFDVIDFDLSSPQGRSIVTTLNGGTPDYMQAIHEGDRIEVYWK